MEKIDKSSFQASKEPIIDFENISYSYDGFFALKEVSLKISLGEMFFITGESGAGKTTLLNLVKRSLRESSQKLRVAFVAQHIQLIEKFSVMDNLWVSFSERTHGSYRQFEHEALELAKYFLIFEKLDSPLKNANGGLRQIIALMRALLARPDILILDEPTKSLDEKNAIKAFEMMNYYCQKKKMTVLWASHNRTLIKQFSGRMIHLEKGRIVYSGQACFI